jgi:glycosyltransferase involved in cell wall biosynthesis
VSRILKIAVDARPLAFPNAGIGRYLGNILRELASAQVPHRFLLYCDRPFEQRFPLPQHWTVRTGNIQSRGRSTAFAQFYFPLWAFRDGIDVFWSPRHQLPLLLPPRCRKVLTVHDVVWKRISHTMTWDAIALESLLMPLSLRMANQVITVSNFSRSEILSFFPHARKKLTVVYLASSLRSDGNPGDCPLSAPYFLIVGSYEPRKNLERVLHAYARYRELTPHPIDLVIVGTEQWGSFSASSFVETRHLQSSVHLIRRADDATLRALYANARALIMASLYEGFGLPMVEAMQWSIPLIASNASSIPEVAGNAALLVDPCDQEAIALALTRISEDEVLHGGLAEKAQARGLEFSWKRTAAATLALLLGDLAEDRNGPAEINRSGTFE